MDSESDDLGVMLDADGRVTGCPPAIHFDWRCFDLSPLASLDLKALRIDCTATSFPMSAKPSWLAADAEPRCALVLASGASPMLTAVTGANGTPDL